MWKDFFYFSKSQRIGIITLLILILITSSISIYLSVYTVDEPSTDTEFLAQAMAFEKSLVERDSLRNTQWKSKFENEYKQNYEKYKNQNQAYTLSKFDPNTADSATFVRLGLKPYIASNILKFRAKGGTFRTPESFAKVYGISPEKMEELKPYISITLKQVAQIDSSKIKTKTQKFENISVDLNSADTTELMKVIGIGRGYAKAIIRFRKMAGGYTNLEQLKELYGMTDANFEKIRPYCRINNALIQKISINIASVDKLNAHPYLNFYESKAIYEYRRRKGKIKNISELETITELKPESLQKIKAYLSFE